MIVSFINIVGRVFGAEHTLLSFESIKESYNINLFDTVKALSYGLIRGFVGWGITAVSIGFLLYFLLKVII